VAAVRVQRFPVPGRRGWEFGEEVISASGSRCALTHTETGATFWCWGNSAEARLKEAYTIIDKIYQDRWDIMADLIEEGDRRGPNVRSLDEPDPAS
jgi:hypothetical protein